LENLQIPRPRDLNYLAENARFVAPSKCCKPSLLHSWPMLQCVAVRCSVLQCVAVYCSVLMTTIWCTCVVVYCSVMQCVAALQFVDDYPLVYLCCSVYTMMPRNTLQHTATRCNTLQHTATHCNTLRHTAIHCNTLHCNTLHHPAPQRKMETHCNTRTYCSCSVFWCVVV